MGMTYAECLMKYNSRCKLVAISGGSRAPALAKTHGVEHVETYQELVKRPDIDGVVVATPPGNHLEHVVSAAEHGKAVTVEKPMASNSKQCEEMIRACKRAGVNFEVLQTQRYRSTNAAAKKMIAEGKLGTVRMIRGNSLFTSAEGGGNWAKLPEHGGPHLDLNCHSFDLIRYLSAGEPKRIYGSVKDFSKTYPLGKLSSMTEIIFDNGVIAQHMSSMEMPEPNLPHSLFGFVVVGEKGILDIDAYGKVMFGQGDEWKLITEFPQIDYIKRPLDPNRLQLFIAAMQRFVDDTLDHKAPLVSGEDGKIAVQMVEASQASSDRGEAVSFPVAV